MKKIFKKWTTRLRRKVFGTQSHKLKQQLILKQSGNQLLIEGLFQEESYLAKELWFVSRFDEETFKMAETDPSSRFQFKVDLTKVREFHEAEEAIYDLFVLVYTPKEALSEKRFAQIESKAKLISRKDGGYDVEYPIRLGRFERTECYGLEPFEIEGIPCIVFRTQKGNISFSMNYELKPDPKIQIDHLKSKGNHMKIDGKLFTRNSRVESVKMVMSGRDTNLKATVPVSLEFLQEDTIKKYGLHRYTYQVDIDLDKAFNREQLKEDIYDLFLELDLHDCNQTTLLKVRKPRFKARYFTKDAHADTGEKIYAITPYFTFRLLNLSLQAVEFERDAFVYLRKMMRWAWIVRPFYRRRDIWIVGERPYKAQDTGYQFFKYMREKYPERNVYYVIEKDSPELKNVKPYGNILYFKSKQHIWHTLMATRVIGSHHPDYLYPLRTKEFKRAVKATKVFLQHGVMGTKNMVANYGRNARSFDTDLFLVSSDFEKEMIVNDFRYDPHEVKVTGLSRFDSLLANDVKTKRQLLIIPTWREWLVTDEAFLESEYFERYRELIHHPRLHALATEYQFDIVFCLHPNMQKFTSYFSNAPVRVISQGEVDVQHLLKESAMMITDYSSVGFDFSFLHKPILYYQFDRKRFIGKRGSHLDLDNDLPGDVVYDVDEILHLIEDYTKTDFQMKNEYRNRAAKFLKYHDTQSCERIFQAIVRFKSQRPWYEPIVRDELFRAVFRRYRKSDLYFPSMRLLYNVARRILPIDEKLMVFESGVGQQYADSPRYIYEEVVRRNLDYKKVWIYNKNIRFSDPNTIRVNRLSPKYYYYLVKARYWINNQNFPHYIKKRAGTTYIQTWHGTPLKKMLFDIDHVHGRDEGYVERVSHAVQNWDYLISPSPYATKAFRSAFRYKGEVLETGYPRNDLFYLPNREEIAKQVHDRLNLPAGKKVILYAPTFRDNQTNEKNKFVFDVDLDFEKMKETLGDEYVLLLRMHVVVKNKIKIPEEYRDFVFNVSSYPDIQELYLVSDILITDYSSVMFDFANLRRPILFYTYDLELYRDQLRGFYMDFEEEAPGPFLRTTEEVIHAILHVEEMQHRYKKRYDNFYDKYCGLEDGKASERIVDKFFLPSSEKGASLQSHSDVQGYRN